MTKTNQLTLGAIGSALSYIFLFFCTAVPTAKLALGFLASFVPCVIYIESKSLKTALITGISTAILAVITLPKSGLGGLIVIMYCVCLCYYPALKALIEKRNNLFIEWILKFIYFSILSITVKFIALKLGIYIYSFFAGTGILIAYDILLTYLISYYIRFISPRIKKSKRKD